MVMLPASSYVKFKATKLKIARVMWRNKRNPCPIPLSNFGYCNSVAEEQLNNFDSKTRTFLGDRYGGDGIGDNGGSARCGIYKGVQVKGIGRNVLAGNKGNYWHSYGGATLREAIREAIWGEVCNLILPHGAIRVYGIIHTGTNVPIHYPSPGGALFNPRALIVREMPIRPAHYMSAFNFKPATGGPTITDSLRTRTAVETLVASLRSQKYSNVNIGNYGNVVDLFLPFVRAHAEQLAVAFTKRIMHGSLTSSNICLNAKWVDFGSASTLSDYGRLILARRMPDFWREKDCILKIFHDLLFYIEKYSSLKFCRAEAFALITRIFLEVFERERQKRFLFLLGFTSEHLLRIPTEISKPLLSVIDTLIASGNKYPSKLLDPCDKYSPFMPDKMGANKTARIFVLAALSSRKDECFNMLANEINDESLRSNFCEKYWVVRLAAFGEKPNESELLFLKIKVSLQNADLDFLYFSNLNNEVEAICREISHVDDFIDSSVERARAFYQPMDEDADISFWTKAKFKINKLGIFDEFFNKVPVHNIISKIFPDILPWKYLEIFLRYDK